MRHYSLFILLFIFQISFGQKFYNKLEINLETFPDELYELKNWIKSKTDTLFYSGYFYESTNRFSLVGRKEKFNWSIPDAGLDIVIDSKQIDSGLLHKTPSLAISYYSESKRISRYHQNFNYKELTNSKYYYEYAIDFGDFSEEELFNSIVRDYNLSFFLKKINEKYHTHFTPEDLLKYYYCESEETYLDRLKNNSLGQDYVIGRCQRNKYQQYLAMLQDELSIFESISNMSFDLFIKNHNEEIENSNLSNFLLSLYGNQDYALEIRNSLIQEIIFYDFPAKIFYLENLSENFQIEEAVFSLIPTENSFYFEAKFKGIANSKLSYNMFKIVFHETYFESFFCVNENCNDKYLRKRSSYKELNP